MAAEFKIVSLLKSVYLCVIAAVCALQSILMASVFKPLAFAQSKVCSVRRHGPKRTLSLWSVAAFALLFVLFNLSSAFAAAPPDGTTITNIAVATYSVGGTGTTNPSNPINTITVGASKTPATLEFYKYAPSSATTLNVEPTGYSPSGSTLGPFTPLLPPVTSSVPSVAIDINVLVPLAPTDLYHGGDPVFMVLTDLDQNLNAGVAEVISITVTVAATGESEVLQFIESDLNTGIFIGYIQSAIGAGTINDGSLSVTDGSEIVASYLDPNDGLDVFAAAVLVDPYGIIFDSITGLPVDGATVRLVDAVSGLDATVYGDDGVSLYPATVISGGTAFDGVKTYNFPPGGFRFPFIAPGTYILEVTPPGGYSSPSVVPTATLQALPGAPYAIALPGSRGEVFTVDPGPALHIDIPIDPVVTAIFVRKYVDKKVVSHGDYLLYTVEVENFSGGTITGGTLTDTLPNGLRYESGTSKIDGVSIPDPSIAGDGRTLSYALPDLPAATKITVTYIVSVSASARNGMASNVATVGDGVLSSNVAEAYVEIKEDLFRSRNVIVGKVIFGDCDTPPENLMGLQGTRVYLEDGTYAITDSEGRYHFEGLGDGAHVVQLDITTMEDIFEAVPCEKNTRFAGRSYSQFVELQGGTLWRADFHVALKPAILGKATLELNSEILGDVVEYEMPINTGTIPLRNINLTVVLPLGATYIPGTLLMDDVAIEEPIITDNMLAIRLDIMGEEFMTVITLKTALKEMRKEQLLEARAMLAFDTPSQRHQMTPVAVNVIDIFDYDIKKEKLPEFTLRPHFPVLGTELSESDKEELDKIVAEVEGTDVVSIFVVGHTSSVLISEKNRHLFADNYALSLARAESVADYFKDKLTLDDSNIISEGKGFDEPVATNDTKEGKALNRRVEVRLLTEKAYRKYMATDTRVNSEEVSVATYSKRGALLWEDERDNEARDHSKFTVESMRRNLSPDDKPGFEWFFPDENVYPPIARYSPSVKHEAGMKVVLYLDGEEVNPVYFEGIDKNSGNTVLLSNWRGVVLSEGDNLFAAVGVDKDGNEVERIERVVHYSTAPVVAKLMEERSRLTADGKTVPIIAIRLTDKDGHPARKGIVGEFSVEEPYRAHRRIEELDLAPMLGRDKVMSQYLVEDDGTIYLELEPTSESGEAVVRINLASGVHEIRPYIIAQARELILVGIAEGTLAYDTIDGNMVAAKASGAEEDIHEEGRLAFYAKGSIKGEYLLTVAFDSESGTEEDRQKLHGIIDPGTYYTVYGDATEQRYEGTSSEKLYLKIEKGKFYALFGDYRTGLTVTKLSRYNRSLTGFKTEAHGENYEIKAFASQTHQSFMRDELRGDGTSGLYYLSLGGIVENSEKIIIETRDRTRSEVIVSSRALTRHIDYDINYDDSSIYFKEPIASRDVSFNPIYIVVDYESYDPVGDAWNYGGRIGYNFKEHKVKAGATVVHEGTVGGSGDLLGIDVAYELTKYSTLSAEMARTEKEFYNVRSSGDAYLVELSRDGKKLDLRAYFREQEGTFGLGQQNGTESDTRKYGIEGVYQSSDRLAYSWLAFRDINLSTDSERTVAEAKASYRNTGYSGFVGLRRAVDLFKGFDDKVSTQLMLGGTLDVLKGKVKLKLQHDQSIFGANENADYPTRTTFGVDYIINNYVTLFGVQEFTYGKDKESNSTRAGFRSTPWRGSDVTSSVGRQFNENGERVFTNTGLRQAYNISEKFSLNGSFEKSDTIKDLNAPKHNLNVPSSSADPDDFTAISLGASYKAIDWGLSARVDYRVSPLQIKRTIFAGVYGEVREGLGVTFSYLEGRVENEVQPDSHNINVRVGTVYRPLFGKWTLLDKFDYVLHEDPNSAMEFAEKKLVNNLNVNYKLNRETQIAFQYGSRYVVDHIDGIEFEGYTDLMGVEARRDLTNNFDIGLYASLLRTFETGVTDHRVGASFGYSFATNMWLSLGYNIAGFEDEDFSNGDYTSKGPFIRFRLKFDQNSLNSTMKWLGGFNSDK